MSEATVGDGAPIVNPSIELRPGLRGVPKGFLCRAVDLRAEMRLSKETWSMWKAAGLPTISLGTESELVATDELFEWLASRPTLTPRPSVGKKLSRAARKKDG